MRGAGWLVLGVLLLAGAPARGEGLAAVAVAPGGKVVAAGGTNRVVYLLDDKLAVRRRVWLGARVAGLAFSRDGSRLLVEDDSGSLRFLDPRDGKEVLRVDRVRGAAFAPGADLVAVRDTSQLTGTALRVLSMTDGKDRARVETREAAAGFALSADGKRLVVLSAGQSGSERRVSLAEAPKELTGLARREWEQRHDGLIAFLRAFEVPGGKLLRESRLWYTSDSPSTLVVPAGESVLVLNFGNTCARVNAKGEVSLFQTGVLFNYGLGASADGKVLVGGGQREGVVHRAGGRATRFTVDALPGWPEYFARFLVTGDGTVYGVTTAFRLVKVTRGGKVEKVVPVY
jgi:hypothetical protein